MAKRIHYLVRDLRDEGHPDGPKLSRARYASKEEAVTQAKVELEFGRRVVQVEDAKGAVAWKP
jgi:hypothetical protein